ncbi:MAG: type II toxin-antitoxin system RelE/ParE family toxin [bacterium]|nr:type II toxin-antitoxin system RelE/ParE family toxin [bacterium]
MAEKRKTMKIYLDSNGKEPFIEWLESIKDRKTRHRIVARLDRLEVGNPGDHRHLEDGVFELRLHFGPGYRIYYGEDGPVIIILLMGGDKSTQSKDIKKAISFWTKYKEAKK